MICLSHANVKCKSLILRYKETMLNNGNCMWKKVLVLLILLWFHKIERTAVDGFYKAFHSHQERKPDCLSPVWNTSVAEPLGTQRSRWRQVRGRTDFPKQTDTWERLKFKWTLACEQTLSVICLNLDEPKTLNESHCCVNQSEKGKHKMKKTTTMLASQWHQQK